MAGGRPPNALVGRPDSSAGRPIVAGLAPFRRELSTRATASDLWASLETAFTQPHGYRRLEELHGVSIDTADRLRARAFLNQARQYYGAVGGLSPVAKPLLAYYFALNLTKAFLTVTDPGTTSSKLAHGLTDAHTPGRNYSFKRERFKVKSAGVFRLLAERTGMGHCWGNNYELGLHELAPYLPEAASLYADAYGDAPKLLPLEDVTVLFNSQQKLAWLRVEVSRHVLQQRRISPGSLLTRARIFGSMFRFVHTEDESVHSFELSQPVQYSHKKSEVLAQLAETFDQCLLACDRSFPGTRRFVVLSDRTHLLSHEAVTFAVLHHLSNLVRYRPSDAERILGSQHAWLLTSWVDRAAEGFLLNLSSRITWEEHVLV